MKTKTLIGVAGLILIGAAAYYFSTFNNRGGTEITTNTPPAASSTKPVAAYIASIEGNKISLDYVDASDPLNDQNNNPKLRTFTLAADVEITSERNVTLTLQQLKEEGLAHPVAVNGGKLGGPLFAVTFNSKGEVQKLQGTFRP
jgi:hypothetical protein